MNCNWTPHESRPTPSECWNIPPWNIKNLRGRVQHENGRELIETLQKSFCRKQAYFSEEINPKQHDHIRLHPWKFNSYHVRYRPNVSTHIFRRQGNHTFTNPPKHTHATHTHTQLFQDKYSEVTFGYYICATFSCFSSSSPHRVGTLAVPFHRVSLHLTLGLLASLVPKGLYWIATLGSRPSSTLSRCCNYYLQYVCILSLIHI